MPRPGNFIDSVRRRTRWSRPTPGRLALPYPAVDTYYLSLALIQLGLVKEPEAERLHKAYLKIEKSVERRRGAHPLNRGSAHQHSPTVEAGR